MEYLIKNTSQCEVLPPATTHMSSRISPRQIKRLRQRQLKKKQTNIKTHSTNKQTMRGFL